MGLAIPWKLSVALVAAVALAACLETGRPAGDDAGDLAPDTEDAWAKIRGLLADVPCKVESVGRGTTDNVLVLSRQEFERTGTLQADHAPGLILMSRPGGFALVDISNPLEPVLRTEYSDAGGSLDVKFSPDNHTALIGTSRGLHMVDIRDPDTPEPAGEWSINDHPAPPAGPAANLEVHMLYTIRINDVDWVFVENVSGTGVLILRLEGPPEARRLTYVTQTLPVHGGYGAPHNVYVEWDADLRAWLMYVANGFDGWMVFDVSDPARPTLVGGWTAPESGFAHTALPAKIGDRRLVVTMAEVGVNFLKIYDATDLRAPVLLGVWQAEPGTGSNRPQHEIQIVDGLLYFAAYGHGVYVFDLRTVGPTPVAETLDLAPIAHYGHTAGRTASPPTFYNDFKDVLVVDGLIYASNQHDGLHVLGFGCATAGDPRLTSTA